MAKTGRIQHPRDWPAITSLANLPNVSGSATQSASLEVGDLCFNTATELQYVCRTATVGSAVWYCPQLLWDPLAIFPSYGHIYGPFQGNGCTDFLHSSGGTYPFSTGTNGGAGTTVLSTAPLAGRYGVLQPQTGTTTTGQAYISATGASIVLGSGRVRWRGDVNIPTASDGTETFTVWMGINDGAGLGADCASFRYSHTENSGNWTAFCRSNSVETGSVVNTGVAAVHATNYAALEIEINAAGTSADFRINGANVATITTNIPTGTARATGVIMAIVKSAGITNRVFNLDLAGVRPERTSPI